MNQKKKEKRTFVANNDGSYNNDNTDEMISHNDND